MADRGGVEVASPGHSAVNTKVFGDMKLIGELYRPDIAMIPIGSHYTMGPREMALARRLLAVREVIPMHFGTFPVLTGTPAMLRDLTRDLARLRVHEPRPGQSL